MGKKPRAAGERADDEPGCAPGGVSRPFEPAPERPGDETARRLARLVRLERRLDDARALEERRRRQVAAARTRVARLQEKLEMLGAVVPPTIASSSAGPPDEDDSKDFMRLVAREAAKAIRDSSAGDNSLTTRVGARRAAHARTMARGNARRPPST